MTAHLVRLSESDLQQLAAALRSRRISAPFNSFGVGRILPRTAAHTVAAELQQFSDEGYGELQIATMLDLIVQDRESREKDGNIIELVTTGPEPPGVTNRDTSVVVRELFAGAQESVLVAGYAVYQGQQVFRALADRMADRGDLKVRMFLDVQRGWGDTSAPDQLSRRFAARFRTQQWPADRPLPDVYFDPRAAELEAAKRACLHAKTVVVDRHTVFVSSANFTEAAQEQNIEIGLLVKSPRLAEQITGHFNALTAAGLLQRIL